MFSVITFFSHLSSLLSSDLASWLPYVAFHVSSTLQYLHQSFLSAKLTLQPSPPPPPFSEWRLVHKGSVTFGPHLWLVGHLDKHVDHVTFIPPTITATASPPTASTEVPVNAPATDAKPLMNEELLQSIGFLPSGSSKSASLPKVDNSGSGNSITGSSAKLIDTFEVVENADQIETMDSGDFVVVVPDCFDLDKPLSTFNPPENLSYSLEAPKGDVVTQYLSDLTLSCDNHVTCTSARKDLATGAVAIATPALDKTAPQAIGSAGPAVIRKKGNLGPALTLRKLRGGLYRKPWAVATGLVNAVSGYVDEKVHFVPSSGPAKEDGGCPPQANQPELEKSCSDSSDEEFEVSAVCRVCHLFAHINFHANVNLLATLSILFQY